MRELSDVERPSSSLSTTAASLNDGTNQQLVDKGVSKIPKSATCGVPLSSAAAKKDATNSADKNILPTELDNIRYLTSNSNADQMHSFSTQVKIVNNNGGGGAEESNNDLPDECESDEEGNEDDIYLEPDLPFASEEDVMGKLKFEILFLLFFSL